MHVHAHNSLCSPPPYDLNLSLDCVHICNHVTGRNRFQANSLAIWVIDCLNKVFPPIYLIVFFQVYSFLGSSLCVGCAEACDVVLFCNLLGSNLAYAWLRRSTSLHYL